MTNFWEFFHFLIFFSSLSDGHHDQKRAYFCIFEWKKKSQNWQKNKQSAIFKKHSFGNFYFIFILLLFWCSTVIFLNVSYHILLNFKHFDFWTNWKSKEIKKCIRTQEKQRCKSVFLWFCDFGNKKNKLKMS